jgi:mannose-6-phosphate isomerase-like protein (cupin superfamily)
LLAAAILIPVAVIAQPRPGNPTTATVITKAEIDKISATEQSAQTRDENARVVDIGDGWSMELGIVHRSKQRVMTVGEAQAARGRGNAPAAAARGNAQAAAPTTPCGEQMTNPPADALQGAITHDNQTEGYYIVSGGGTAFIDGKVVNGRRSTNNPDGGPNGPGCGGGVAVGSRKVELKVGDVLIVPPGVIHGWFDIPDHVDYLSFRPSHGVMKNGWVNPTIASK